MNILYSTHMAPPYIDPAPWPGDQLICGPDWSDGPRSLRTPKANYDLAELVARLPAGWQPDLFIAYVDSHGLCVPNNLAALSCPKLLIIGDVHHGVAPLSKVINHARSERYDLHVVLPTRQSCHWFTEAGMAPVIHCGAQLLIRPYEGEMVRERYPVIGFAGQAGSEHIRRRRLIDGLAACGLPVHAGDAPQEVALRKWAKCQLAFNCSLNGDVNMRTYEILSAGGCLFADRLFEEAGLDLEDGRHAIFYDSEDHLIDLATHWLARPEDCLKIGLAGRDAFLAANTPAVKMAQVLAVLDGGKVHPSLLPPPAALVADGPPLGQRIAAYEILQELHRTKECLDVLFDGPLVTACAVDAADLPRLIPRLAQPYSLPDSRRSRRVHLDSAGVPDVLVVDATQLRRPPDGPTHLLTVGQATISTVAALSQAGWRIAAEAPGGATMLAKG
jgi:hypothetical protein